jgi:hypothetical protein
VKLQKYTHAIVERFLGEIEDCRNFKKYTGILLSDCFGK